MPLRPGEIPQSVRDRITDELDNRAPETRPDLVSDVELANRKAVFEELQTKYKERAEARIDDQLKRTTAKPFRKIKKFWQERPQLKAALKTGLGVLGVGGSLIAATAISGGAAALIPIVAGVSAKLAARGVLDIAGQRVGARYTSEIAEKRVAPGADAGLKETGHAAIFNTGSIRKALGQLDLEFHHDLLSVFSSADADSDPAEYAQQLLDRITADVGEIFVEDPVGSGTFERATVEEFLQPHPGDFPGASFAAGSRAGVHTELYVSDGAGRFKSFEIIDPSAPAGIRAGDSIDLVDYCSQRFRNEIEQFSKEQMTARETEMRAKVKEVFEKYEKARIKAERDLFTSESVRNKTSELLSSAAALSLGIFHGIALDVDADNVRHTVKLGWNGLQFISDNGITKLLASAGAQFPWINAATSALLNVATVAGTVGMGSGTLRQKVQPRWDNGAMTYPDLPLAHSTTPAPATPPEATPFAAAEIGNEPYIGATKDRLTIPRPLVPTSGGMPAGMNEDVFGAQEIGIDVVNGAEGNPGTADAPGSREAAARQADLGFARNNLVGALQAAQGLASPAEAERELQDLFTLTDTTLPAEAGATAPTVIYLPMHITDEERRRLLTARLDAAGLMGTSSSGDADELRTALSRGKIRFIVEGASTNPRDKARAERELHAELVRISNEMAAISTARGRNATADDFYKPTDCPVTVVPVGVDTEVEEYLRAFYDVPSAQPHGPFITLDQSRTVSGPVNPMAGLDKYRPVDVIKPNTDIATPVHSQFTKTVPFTYRVTQPALTEDRANLPTNAVEIRAQAALAQAQNEARAYNGGPIGQMLGVDYVAALKNFHGAHADGTLVQMEALTADSQASLMPAIGSFLLQVIAANAATQGVELNGARLGFTKPQNDGDLEALLAKPLMITVAVPDSSFTADKRRIESEIAQVVNLINQDLQSRGISRTFNVRALCVPEKSESSTNGSSVNWRQISNSYLSCAQDRGKSLSVVDMTSPVSATSPFLMDSIQSNHYEAPVVDAIPNVSDTSLSLPQDNYSFNVSRAARAASPNAAPAMDQMLNSAVYPDARLDINVLTQAFGALDAGAAAQLQQRKDQALQAYRQIFSSGGQSYVLHADSLISTLDSLFSAQGSGGQAVYVSGVDGAGSMSDASGRYDYALYRAIMHFIPGKIIEDAQLNLGLTNGGSALAQLKTVMDDLAQHVVNNPGTKIPIILEITDPSFDPAQADAISQVAQNQLNDFLKKMRKDIGAIFTLARRQDPANPAPATAPDLTQVFSVSCAFRKNTSGDADPRTLLNVYGETPCADNSKRAKLIVL